MRRVLCLLLFVPVVFPASSGQEPARPANASVSGRWVVNTDFYGSTIYFRMELKQQGEKLSGNFDGDKLEGTLKGNSIYLLAKDEQGGTDEGKGTLAGATITGTIVFTHADDAAHPQTMVLRISARAAFDDDVIAGFQRDARNALLRELLARAPFDRPSLHVALVVRRFDMNEGVRVPVEELDQVPFDLLDLVLEVGCRERMVGLDGLCPERHANDHQKTRRAFHVPPPAFRTTVCYQLATATAPDHKSANAAGRRMPRAITAKAPRCPASSSFHAT